MHLEALKKAIEKRLVQENEEEDLPKVVITVRKIDDDTWEHWSDIEQPEKQEKAEKKTKAAGQKPRRKK
jgi:hypothetical protein